MNKNIYEARTKEEAINKALEEQKTTQDNLLIKVIEEKNGLLKKSVRIEVINLNDVINYTKEKIMEITKLMNIEVNLELRRRDNQIAFKLFSNNNAILIGKNGKNIQALQMIVRQIILAQTGEYLKINLDVENYRENKNRAIEKLAQEVAEEVALTKTETQLDSMNSYERRIVHSILADNKFVYTESVGEEPDRRVVIKPKEV